MAGGAVAIPKPRVRLLPLERVKLLSVHVQWAGRNGKLTETLLAQIVEHLLIGMPVASVCDLVGISIESWSTWKKKGESYLSKGEPVEYEIYGSFVIEVKRSIAEWEKGVVERSLHTQTYKATWARDLTLLERRKRDDWAPPSQGGRGQGAPVDPDMKFL